MKKIFLYLLMVILINSVYSQELTSYLEESYFKGSFCFHDGHIFHSGANGVYKSDYNGRIVKYYNGIFGDEIGIDHKGRIWLGSSHYFGLRYWEEGKVIKFSGKSTNFIKRNNDDLWIGMRDLLIKVTPNGIDTVANETYNDICFSKDGQTTWLTRGKSPGGIHKISPEGIELYEPEGGRFFYSIDIDDSGKIWTSTSDLHGDLFSFDGSSWENPKDKNGFSPSKFYRLLFDSKGTLHGFADSKYFTLANSEWIEHPFPKLYRDTYESRWLNIKKAPNGEVFFTRGTKQDYYHGLHSFKNGQWYYIKFLKYSYPSYTKALDIDSLGNIWFGGLAGFGYITGERFNFVNDWVNWVNDIEVASDGKIWYGGNFETFGYWDYNTGINKLDTLSVLSGIVYSIFEDENKKIWAGISGGAITNRSGVWELIDTTDGLPEGDVTAIIGDHNGTIFFGMDGNGIAKLKDGTWTYIDEEDGLDAKSIVDMEIGKEGKLWVQGLSYYSIYDKEEWTNFRGNAYDINIDSNNRVFFSTTSGLNMYEDGSWTSLYSPTLNRNVRASIVDENGQIWFGGGGGFFRLNPNHELDYDGDGLTDAEEEFLGTKPFDLDSDYDFVGDKKDSSPLDPNKANNNIWYADIDNDGFGKYDDILIADSKPENYVLDRSDCNDQDATITPLTNWYPDQDEDKFGSDDYLMFVTCYGESYGLAKNNSDCDDSNPLVYPGANYSATGIDNNCNGIIEQEERIISQIISETLCEGDSFTYQDSIYNTPGVHYYNYTSFDRYYTTQIELNYYPNEIDNSITINNNTLVSNSVGAQYQWLDCDNNFANLQGENKQTFNVVESGSYAVKVINGNCVDTSDCVSVQITTNIIRNDFDGNLKIYPNPFNQELNIELDKQYNTVTYNVFNLQGVLLISDIIHDNNSLTLNLNLKSGNYLIEIKTDEDKSCLFKVIKE